MSQSPTELKSGPITRAQRRKLKAIEDNGIVAYLEEALESKITQGTKLELKIGQVFEEDPLPSLVGFCRCFLWSMTPTAHGRSYTTVAGRVRERVLPLNVWFIRLRSSYVFHWSVETTKSSIEVLHEGGDLGKVLNQIYMQLKIHIKVVSEQPLIEGLIISKDGHLPTQCHQERTSDSTRMNLNETLRFIQQLIEGLAGRFQSVAKDTKKMTFPNTSKIVVNCTKTVGKSHSP
ncbi:hypothetical protein M9H77_23145 [Catharanthus roseus]|uniref:Uncharacterized protein n=1 Tax=Catharanthus roseus TaxID=4058 RepID=A0ACC0AS36_CATRO|nr:hypothetical protein M9H77_23145 [Catharanthus roseus]